MSVIIPSASPPPKKPPPKIPGDVIGKERRLNDRDCKKFAMINARSQSRSTESQKKHKTHDNTKLSSPAPKECKQHNLHESHTVSIANPFFFHS